MNIAFFGNTKYSVIDAKILHYKFGLKLIVTKQDKPSGRQRILAPNPAKTFALENKIPVIEAEKLTKEIVKEIKKHDLDFLVVADYGVILPKEALQIPKIAPLNVHHSLLPKYRGPSPAPAAILAGDKTSGVTIIKMAEEVDAGDILAQKEYQLKENETTDSLLIKLNELGGPLVCEVMENYDSLKPKPQDESSATLTERMSKKDGYIDINNPPDHTKLDRMVRAYYPWPTVWTKIDGKIVKFLPNQMIQPEGKRPMTIKEFLNGYPKTKDLIEKLTA